MLVWATLVSGEKLDWEGGAGRTPTRYFFAHVVGRAQDLCLLIVSMRKLQVNFELHEYHYHYNRVQLSPVRSVGSRSPSTRT